MSCDDGEDVERMLPYKKSAAMVRLIREYRKVEGEFIWIQGKSDLWCTLD